MSESTELAYLDGWLTLTYNGQPVQPLGIESDALPDDGSRDVGGES